MSHSPIIAPREIATEVLDPIMDRATALHCDACGETLSPAGVCLNVATCHEAHAAGSRLARGESLKARLAPRAFTIRGSVD